MRDGEGPPSTPVGLSRPVDRMGNCHPCPHAILAGGSQPLSLLLCNEAYRSSLSLSLPSLPLARSRMQLPACGYFSPCFSTGLLPAPHRADEGGAAVLSAAGESPDRRPAPHPATAPAAWAGGRRRSALGSPPGQQKGPRLSWLHGGMGARPRSEAAPAGRASG